MTRMTQAEKESFLAALHVGVLSIPRDGAAPLSAPVWYQYSPGGELWVMTGTNSRKGKVLKEGLPVSFCVQNESPPYAYVTVDGHVSSIRQSLMEEELRPLARRYLGQTAGDAYADRDGVTNTITVRVKIDHWLAVDYSKTGA